MKKTKQNKKQRNGKRKNFADGDCGRKTTKTKKRPDWGNDSWQSGGFLIYLFLLLGFFLRGVEKWWFLAQKTVACGLKKREINGKKTKKETKTGGLVRSLVLGEKPLVFLRMKTKKKKIGISGFVDKKKNTKCR